VFQWAVSIPAAPSGSPTYTWSTGGISAIPSGWSATPGTAPSQGMTLWAARVFITDSATNSTTTFNWSSSAVVAVGYSGSNGTAGTAGASYVTAYCASSTASTTTAPSATTGKTSLPATNSGGITGTWSATVPSLTSGQYLYQSDGIYDPTTNQVTWSIPYWSSLKVGNLSAITANMGSINAGNIDLGSGATSWHVDANGNMWSGASTMASSPFKVDNAGNATLKSVEIRDATTGNLIFTSGKSLAQQASSNPNLCPTPRGMTMYNTATGNRNGDVRFGDGQYVWIAPTGDSSYSGAESQALGIPAASAYTVSFDAYCTTAGRVLNVDVVNSIDYDSTGISVALTTTMTRYSFTETALNNSNASLCRLRMFTAASGGGNIVIANIKVELGNTVTPWCSSVITVDNASTFIASGAIKNAHIGTAAINLANINTASISNLSAVSATIGTLRTTSSGARIEISDNLIVGYRSNNTMSFKISA